MYNYQILCILNWFKKNQAPITAPKARSISKMHFYFLVGVASIIGATGKDAKSKNLKGDTSPIKQTITLPKSVTMGIQTCDLAPVLLDKALITPRETQAISKGLKLFPYNFSKLHLA